MAWIFTEEDFIKNHHSFLSFGKIRASYGSTGNDQIGDYRFLSLYNPMYGAYQGSGGLEPTGISNPYLTWEATKKTQVGLDFGFFDDRIVTNITYSRNRSSNQLLEYSLPTITGQSGIIQNFPATVQNTSFEFTIQTSNIKSQNFTWSSSINFTTPGNKLIAFPDLS